MDDESLAAMPRVRLSVIREQCTYPPGGESG
jgi:hypothetical protein